MYTEAYRELNAECHEQNRGWGRGGLKFLDKVLSATEIEDTVLDYGCGKGELVRALNEHGRRATGYDPAVPEFREYDVKVYDFVACTDVLEHVEPKYVGSVVYDLYNVTGHKGAFLVISTVPAVKTLPDGSNAHRSVQDADWWFDVLKARFAEVRELRRSPTTVEFHVRA